MIRFNEKMVTSWDEFAHVIYNDYGKNRMMLQIGDIDDADGYYDIRLTKDEAQKLAKMLLKASEFMEDAK